MVFENFKHNLNKQGKRYNYTSLDTARLFGIATLQYRKIRSISPPAY